MVCNEAGRGVAGERGGAFDEPALCWLVRPVGGGRLVDETKDATSVRCESSVDPDGLRVEAIVQPSEADSSPLSAGSDANSGAASSA